MSIAIPNNPRFKNFTDQTFGQLTVVSYAGKRPSGNHIWNCVCSCGKSRLVQSSNLVSGHVTSCGCIKRENLKDRRFGRLVVIEYLGSVKYVRAPKPKWLCQCDCGQMVSVMSQSLMQGHTVSCGCYHRDEASDRLTTHGRTGTQAYKRMHKLRRRGLEKDLDINWTKVLETCLKEFQTECVLCESTDNLTVDHVRPLSKGFGLQPGNAVMLCSSCNSSKHDKDLDELPREHAALLVKAAAAFEQHVQETTGA